MQHIFLPLGIKDHIRGPQTPEAVITQGNQFLIGPMHQVCRLPVRLEDGRWCLFLDYYGVPGAGQGYVPFVAPSLKSGAFVRSDRAFSFPYGFKHGTILTVDETAYERIRTFQWPQN